MEMTIFNEIRFCCQLEDFPKPGESLVREYKFPIWVKAFMRDVPHNRDI